MKQSWADVETHDIHECLEDELDAETFLDWLDTDHGELMETLLAFGPVEHAHYQAGNTASPDLTEEEETENEEESVKGHSDAFAIGPNLDLDGTRLQAGTRASDVSQATVIPDSTGLRRSVRLSVKQWEATSRGQAQPFAVAKASVKTKKKQCQVEVSKTAAAILDDQSSACPVTPRRSARLANKAFPPKAQGSTRLRTFKAADTSSPKKRCADNAFAGETISAETRPVKRASRSRSQRR